MTLLTVCIPVFNEEAFIDDLLKSVTSAPPSDKEIILIDGGSTDGTRDKIASWQANHGNIRLVTNEQRYVSHGFNKAFRESESKYISLTGAHAIYPQSYFETGINILESDEADAVGGPLRQTGATEKGRVIAACMSSRFGVGGTEFRTTKKRGYVQSVPMAIYKREIFIKTGLFDEALIRNQDDEFHYRLNAKGFRILMEPQMESTYYVRDDFRSLWRQYYGYGLYKPLVIRKVRSGMRPRHLVPAMFVAYLVLLPLLMAFTLFSIIPLLLYLFLTLGISLTVSRNFRQFLWAAVSFPVLHISYGAGFISGLGKLL